MRQGIRFVLILIAGAAAVWLAAFGLRSLLWPEEDDRAPRREEPSFDFVDYLGPQHDNVVFIADPIVAIRRLREMRAFAPFVGDPEEHQADAPSGIMVAADDELYVALTRIDRLTAWLGLCEGASYAGERSLELELPTLQRLVAEELEAFRVPEIVVWLEFMDDDAATRLMAKAKSAATTVPEWLSLVESSDERIVVSFSVASYLGREGVRSMLRDRKVVRGANDPIEPRLVDAVMRFEIVASLRIDDNAVIAEVGPPRSQDLAADGDPPDADLLEDHAETLLAWARWDVTRASELAREMDRVLDDWRGMDAGRAWQDADGYGGADIGLLLRYLQKMGGRGELRIDLRDGIHVEKIVEDAPAAKPIANGTLTKVVPRQHAGVYLSTTDSLADVVLDAMTRFEATLQREEVQAGLHDDEEEIERLERKSAAYYQDFRAVRERLVEQSIEHFEPGIGFILGDREHMGTLHLTAEGRAMTIRVPAIAVVGKPRRMKDAMAWVESVAEHVALGLGWRKKTPLVSRQNLGLRGPTRVVTLHWVHRLKNGAEVRAGSDIQLHYFAYDEYLVISTSPELSRELIRVDTAGVTVPSRALSYGVFSASKLVDILEAYSGGEERGLEDAFDVARALGPITLESFDEDGHRRTSLHVGLD